MSQWLKERGGTRLEPVQSTPGNNEEEQSLPIGSKEDYCPVRRAKLLLLKGMGFQSGIQTIEIN